MNAEYFKIEEVMTNDPELVEEAKSHKSMEFSASDDGSNSVEEQESIQENIDQENSDNLAKCPSCGNKSLKVEGGCHSCVNEECGYSKCDV